MSDGYSREKLTCPSCNGQFYADRKGTKYCSEACKRIGYLKRRGIQSHRRIPRWAK